MLLEQIKNIVYKAKEKKLTTSYTINLVKEYLQNIVLEYIYSNKEVNAKLIFTGGTCLRFCFNLPRLSEDLDFDCETPVDYNSIAENIKKYFQETLKYEEITYSIKGSGRKIYLKFPFLQQLGLEFERSFILLLKIEISQVELHEAKVETSLLEKNGRTYYLKRYSLPDLMVGKIHAFLMRMFFKGKENEIDFKGRDLYDLVWYMGKNISPNMKRLYTPFKDTKYENMDWLEILEEIRVKAKKINKNSIYQDLVNFIENNGNIDNFWGNYLAVIDQYCSAQKKERGNKQ